MDSHPKKQHYVPKFLLKNFSSKQSHIWVFDKSNMKNNRKFIHERPISRVASEDHFYDKSEFLKSCSFEYELSKIERKVAPIIDKIILSKDVSYISDSEREFLSYFIVLQYLRTKSRLSHISNLSQDLESKLSSFIDLDINYKNLWFDILESADEFKKYIFNKVWFIGTSDDSFYCSDNPVVLQNTTDVRSERGNLGLNSFGIEIYMPISTSLILCFFCEKYLEGHKGKLLNLLEFEDDYIRAVNQLQFHQSERFIFSSTRLFDMI